MPEKTRLVGLRMPEDMYKRIKRASYTENRSFSSMLTLFVQEGIKIYNKEEMKNGS